ncbi:MAG: hypothetical protein ACPG21_07160 [Crocinitomicaceae bacterium]
MKSLKLVISAVLFFSLVACNSNGGSEGEDNFTAPDTTAKEEKAVSETAQTSITDPTRNTYNIELIDSRRWKVNGEMMVHIRNLEADMDTFSAAEEKDYAAIAKTLKSHIGSLTKSCTMKGQAHDELHKWLLPFIDLVNALKNAEADADHASMYVAIEDSMDEFNMYFE